MKNTLRALPYLLSYLIPLSAVLSFSAGGLYSFGTLFFIFALIPLTELILGTDDSNLPEEEYSVMKSKPVYYLLLWGQLAAVYFVLYSFLGFVSAEREVYETLGAVFAAGIVMGGIGITVAHELIHRKELSHRFAGILLLTATCYPHFYIEHIRGHHKNVATDADPASAKKGEAVYTFLIKSVVLSYFSAWQLESERLRKKGRGFISVYNTMIYLHAGQFLLWGLIIHLYDLRVFGYYLAASVIGFTLLEIVNYIEHYGLVRVMTDSGRPEKVSPVHSWNSNNYISRWFLFELTRHADHHMNASREYQILRHFEKSPVHPTGYPGMILLALIPPLWFRVMDPLINEFVKSE